MLRTSKPARIVWALLIALVAQLALLTVTASASYATCYPEPPDYAGCSSAQLKPTTVSQVKGQYTGHAPHYRHYMWGQHKGGVVWKGISPALNHRLATTYADFVKKYRKHNNGHRPAFARWSGFRSHTIAGCVRLRRMPPPDKYCHYKTGSGPQSLNIQATIEDPSFHWLSRCNGAVVTGAVAGGTGALVFGVGELTGGTAVLAGAAVGGVGGEAGCQAKALLDWLHVPGMDRGATSAGWGYN